MGIEIEVLALACLLGLAHDVATGITATSQFGMAYGLGARDEQKQLTGVPARVTRAFENFMQTFPIFAAAALSVAVSGRGNGTTHLGAWLYLIGRVVYAPLYFAGIPVARTVAWAASMLGIVLVLSGLA